MLKLKKEIKKSITSVQIDGCIPLVIEFESTSMTPLYWRGGDGKKTLIEIGLHRNSGIISSMTVVNVCPKKVHEINSVYPEKTSNKESFLACDLSDWGNFSENNFASNFIDEFHLDLELYLGKDFISISLVNMKQSIQFLKNDNVIFGVNTENDIVSIDVTNLSPEEISLIRNSI